MDQLMCMETEAEPKAYSDPVFLDDDRVLKNLMTTEESYTIEVNYFEKVQDEIKPHMRKIVASWMLEICEEELCQEEVFTLAMNIMDRFLSAVNIRKTQLQLLGAVCLFLASKLRQTKPLCAQQLIYYTDNSITMEELMGWELLVLSRLKWDLAAITANDFLNILMRRLPNFMSEAEVQQQIRKHAQTFIALCAAEIEFSAVRPSLIAVGSVASAICGLELEHFKSVKQLIERLSEITSLDYDCIQWCYEQIESLIAKNAAVALMQLSNVQLSTIPAKGATTTIVHHQDDDLSDKENIDTWSSEKSINDIYF